MTTTKPMPPTPPTSSTPSTPPQAPPGSPTSTVSKGSLSAALGSSPTAADVAMEPATRTVPTPTTDSGGADAAGYEVHRASNSASTSAATLQEPPKDQPSQEETPSPSNPLRQAVPHGEATSTSTTRATNEQAAPSLAELLRAGAELRPDRTGQPSTQVEVRRPVPTQAALKQIMEAYAKGVSWGELEALIRDAHPRLAPNGEFHVIIQTGKALRDISQSDYLAAFFKHHGNGELARLIKEGEIIQLKRKAVQDYELYVRSEASVQALVGQKVSFYGAKYLIVEPDPLLKYFYMDVDGVKSTSEMDLLLGMFYVLGWRPIFDTYRSEHVTTWVKGGTRRFYFASRACPAALKRSSTYCDLLVLGDRTFRVSLKGVKRTSGPALFAFNLTDAYHRYTGRWPEGYNPPETSPTDKDVNMDGSGEPAEGNDDSSADSTPTNQRGSNTDGNEGNTHTAGSVEATSRNATNLGNSSVTSTSDMEMPSTPPEPDGATTGTGVTPTRSKTADADGFRTVGNKRGYSPAKAAHTRQSAPTSFESPNYFAILRNATADFELQDLDPSQMCYKLSVTDVSPPRTVKPEKSRVYGYHNGRVQLQDPEDLHAIFAEFGVTVNGADEFAQNKEMLIAKAKQNRSGRRLDSTTNGDKVLSELRQDPLHFVMHMSKAMKENSKTLEDIAMVHMVNRLLNARNPLATESFEDQWADIFGTRLPRTRDEFRKAVEATYPKDPGFAYFWNHNLALALFELFFMAAAPELYSNDHWVHYLTGERVYWLTTPFIRLLPANTLIGLLRSPPGKQLTFRWQTLGWKSTLFSSMLQLQDASLYLEESRDTLVFVKEQGETVISSCSIAARC